MKKGLIGNLLPDYRFKNLIGIDAVLFSGSGLIIFDVDNTLVFPETTETKAEVIEWFKEMKKEHRCLCLSNSRTISKREKRISQVFDCEFFLSKNKKPSKKLFKEIKKKFSFPCSEIVVVGDRVFSDILFGNRSGATTILVEPLTCKEKILTKIFRKTENFIIHCLKPFVKNAQKNRS